MTPQEAEALAAKVLAAIDAAAGWRNEKPHHAADRERVASDLAGLREHAPGAPYCGWTQSGDASHDAVDWPCPDARRYANNLRRTAALYGVTS